MLKNININGISYFSKLQKLKHIKFIGCDLRQYNFCKLVNSVIHSISFIGCIINNRTICTALEHSKISTLTLSKTTFSSNEPITFSSNTIKKFTYDNYCDHTWFFPKCKKLKIHNTTTKINLSIFKLWPTLRSVELHDCSNFTNLNDLAHTHITCFHEHKRVTNMMNDKN